MFELKPLPFDPKAFEPIISERTMHHHYGKHHKGYVDKLNAALSDLGIQCADLQKILRDYKDNKTVWNNAAQHFNHTFYWKSITPGGKACEGRILKLIEAEFGGLSNFEQKFGAYCKQIFGSGWCWLTFDNVKLHIEQTGNADLPVHKPLLVVDVWEHAYYLDYQQNRADYVDAIVKCLDWDMAEKRLTGGV